MSSPMRRYLLDHPGKFGRIAVFVTVGGRGGPKVLLEMTKLAQRRPVATLVLREGDLDDDLVHKVADFVDALQKATARARRIAA